MDYLSRMISYIWQVFSHLNELVRIIGTCPFVASDSVVRGEAGRCDRPVFEVPVSTFTATPSRDTSYTDKVVGSHVTGDDLTVHKAKTDIVAVVPFSKNLSYRYNYARNRDFKALSKDTYYKQLEQYCTSNTKVTKVKLLHKTYVPIMTSQQNKAYMMRTFIHPDDKCVKELLNKRLKMEATQTLTEPRQEEVKDHVEKTTETQSLSLKFLDQVMRAVPASPFGSCEK